MIFEMIFPGKWCDAMSNFRRSNKMVAVGRYQLEYKSGISFLIQQLTRYPY